MLIVTGCVRARRHTIERALELSLEHVFRSRREPLCLPHSVHRDSEDPLRVGFMEHWADAKALRTHFRLPASAVFVHEVAFLADDSPKMSIYDARQITM